MEMAFGPDKRITEIAPTPDAVANTYGILNHLAKISQTLLLFYFHLSD